MLLSERLTFSLTLASITLLCGIAMVILNNQRNS